MSPRGIKLYLKFPTVYKTATSSKERIIKERDIHLYSHNPVTNFPPCSLIIRTSESHIRTRTDASVSKRPINHRDTRINVSYTVHVSGKRNNLETNDQWIARPHGGRIVIVQYMYLYRIITTVDFHPCTIRAKDTCYIEETDTGIHQSGTAHCEFGCHPYE